MTASVTDRVVLIAHGSPDPRHGAGVRRLARRMATALSGRVAASFLEHDTPSARTALADVGGTPGSTTVLPLLLTAGYHWQRDIPPVVAHGGHTVRLVAPPRPVWFAPVAAGLAAGATDIVIASSGSSRPEIGPRFAELVDELHDTGAFRRVGLALSVAALADQVRPGSTVIPFLTADGVLADRIRAVAVAREAAVSPVLGDAPGFAHVLAQSVSADPAAPPRPRHRDHEPDPHTDQRRDDTLHPVAP